MLNNQYFFYKEPTKPYPVNLNLKKTQYLIPKPEISTSQRRHKSQSPTRQHRARYDEYQKKIQEVKYLIPPEPVFQLNKTFTTERGSLTSAESCRVASTKNSLNSPSKSINGNRIMTSENFWQSRRLSTASKPGPPSLDLKSVISSMQTRFEENSAIYGEYSAMILLPSRVLPNNSKPSTPFYKKVHIPELRRKKGRSFDTSAFETQASSFNKTETGVSSVEKGAKPRLNSPLRRKRIATMNDDLNLNKTFEIEEKGFTVKELEKNLNKLTRTGYTVQGNPNHPTLGEKLFQLQAMNDMYLQPLIHHHKKRIFEKRIIL